MRTFVFRTLSKVVLTGFLACTFQAAAFDLNDDLLVAYVLSSEEETAFALDDGELSSFWNAWENHDHIDMNVNTHWYESSAPFDGTEDAGLLVKAATGTNGLYFYAKVTDNVWVPPANFEDIGCDALDLYFDSKTREEIKSTPNSDLATPWGFPITKTTKQIQVWMGAQKFNYSLWDDAIMQFLGIRSLGGYNILEIEDAQTNYDSMGMEIIDIDATTKAQEWFIPWSQLGIDISSIPAEGRTIAFSGGYNDRDGEVTSKLRWLKYDPWSSGPYENPDDEDSEILVGECNCPQNAVNSWGHISLQNPQSISVHHHAATQNIARSNIVKTEYFTLQGKRITTARMKQLKTNSMLIERKFLSNGSSVVKRIQK